MKSIHSIYKQAFFALLFISVAVGCKEVKKESVLVEKKNVMEPKKVVSDKNINSDFAFLETIPTKNIPVVEDTNFDTFTDENKLTASQIKILNLDKIIDNKEVVNVFLNYNLIISRDFKSMVISYERGDAELVTVLVNYDHNYTLIDFKNIAYDEIAENMVSIYCEIKKNEIVCTETDYSNEEPVLTEKKYTILKNGKIKVKPFLN